MLGFAALSTNLHNLYIETSPISHQTCLGPTLAKSYLTVMAVATLNVSP